jgi:hypothetical protein
VTSTFQPVLPAAATISMPALRARWNASYWAWLKSAPPYELFVTRTAILIA